MFEIFLFINPIGIYCYDTERLIRKTVDELGVDVCYHYIPIANVCLVNDDIIRRRKDAQKLPDIGSFSSATYQALQDYHAIKLAYGNKKARRYLYELQKSLSHDASAYTPELLKEITSNLNIKISSIESIKRMITSVLQLRKIKSWLINGTSRLHQLLSYLMKIVTKMEYY